MEQSRTGNNSRTKTLIPLMRDSDFCCFILNASKSPVKEITIFTILYHVVRFGVIRHKVVVASTAWQPRVVFIDHCGRSCGSILPASAEEPKSRNRELIIQTCTLEKNYLKYRLKKGSTLVRGGFSDASVERRIAKAEWKPPFFGNYTS